MLMVGDSRARLQSLISVYLVALTTLSLIFRDMSRAVFGGVVMVWMVIINRRWLPIRRSSA
jgi:hypothetical protein